ncbi:MAG: transglutaminase TgpA family protein [Gammaproteobacteria bacterium]
MPATTFQAHAALAALAAAMLPFFFTLPPWVAGTALAIVGWRALALRHRRRPPGLPVRLALVLAGLLAVVASFRGFGGAEAGGAFLVITAALKALESHNQRDFRIVVLLAFMLLAAAFLLDQSLPLALYAAALVWLATAALLGAGEHPPRWFTLATRAGLLLAAALPVAIALFLLFPRLPGPLFRFGAPQLAAVSGLADTMEPGSIAVLASSDAIAFRVRFEGTVPPPNQRYFRGPVFERYDGSRWLPGQRRYGAGRFRHRGAAVHYRVLERANGTHYLFALALPKQISIPARLSPRYELLTAHRIWNDIGYSAVSWPHYTAQVQLSTAERAANLALPSGADPRTHALADKWRGENVQPAAIVQRALAWFHDQPYYYTLTPGRLNGRNRVDEFLFQTRRGFCEHYASAFAVLMRAAGIPARIVTGYAGGDVNPYDGWLVLRQSNAHAWDEVWLAGRGWVRVDPTSVIPPARVDSSALRAAATSPAGNARLIRTGWLWQVRDLWDAANTAWTQYVVGYGPALQHRLLDRFGLAGAGPFVTALLMAGVALGAGVLVFLFGIARLRSHREDPAQRLYLRWCRRLARRGLVRSPSEGPLDFAARIARLQPQYAATAVEVATLYADARYAEDAAALAALRRSVRRPE